MQLQWKKSQMNWALALACTFLWTLYVQYKGSIVPLGTSLNKDHKLNNLQRHNIVEQLPLGFMIGQPQMRGFGSIQQHVNNALDTLTHQGRALSPEKPTAPSTSCLLLSYIPPKPEMCAPCMQSETDAHFQCLQWMGGSRDWFCVSLADFYSLQV